MRWTVTLLAVSCWPTSDARPGFELELRGAVSLNATGRVDQGPAGQTGDGYYTITLGGTDGQAAVVFTRRSPVPPDAGRFLVGEGQLASDGFSALIIIGAPSHPNGVFEVQHGALWLSRVDDGVAGTFTLHATGYLDTAPEQDDWAVTARGHFGSLASAEDGSPSTGTEPGS